MIDSIQIIEIADMTPPVVIAPDTITVSAGAGCVGDVVLPPAEIQEDCAIDIDVRVQGFFGTIPMNGGIIPNVPVGSYIAIYIARNDCNLEGSDTTIINVIDDEPPVPVCNASVVVPVSSNGMAIVEAGAFDGGSVDNCGPVYFKVRRMDAPTGFECATSANPLYQFDDNIKFCCEDVGNESLMVFLRVYDVQPVSGPVSDDYLAGHFADCMFRVEVQDKIAPQIVCPSDLTISCMFLFDPDNLSVFGTVVTEEADREQICLDDIGNPGTFGLTCVGLDGLATDNCSVIVEEIPVFNMNTQCGTGTIRRIFTATDPGGLTASCEQRITIINYTPFQESDISWPPNYETSDVCDVTLLDPEDLPPPFDAPVVIEDACDLVTYTHSDIVFDFSNSHQACFKILRTWTVLDWCQYESGGSVGIWTRQQIIKVVNTVGPEIAIVEQEMPICTDDPACGPGSVLLEASAEDDCSGPEALRWTVAVDEGNNGSLDQFYNSIGEAISQSVILPLGVHRVLYSVEDFCGNTTTEEQIVTMVSCKPPSAKCMNLATSLMPMDTDNDGLVDWGMIMLEATALDAGSDHVCGNPVTVAFSSDPNNTTRIFDCDDLGENSVQLWVIDDNGNTDFCTVTITVQDNFDVCPDDNVQRSVISGAVKTSVTESVEGVDVILHGSNFKSATNAAGAYTFPPMPHGGAYEIQPYLNTQHKKGVSTLDLIQLQKHLLGIKALDDPYKMIAGDANHSGNLSVMDIIILRRLILGLTDTIPNNTSWRFIDAAYDFQEPSNPLSESFPESYQISILNQDMLNIDFVAVKVGDLNGSVMNDIGECGIATRTPTQPLIFYTDDVQLNADETTRIDIRCDKNALVETMQFTLEWFADKVDIVPVSGVLNDANWNPEHLSTGQLPMSWTVFDRVASEPGLVVLSLDVTAREVIMLSECGIEMGSSITAQEGILSNDVPVTPQMVVRPIESSDDGIVVYQNRPNPFTRKTMVPIVLPAASLTTLEIFNVQGVLVYQSEIMAQKGYNEWMIDAQTLGGQGVYTYRISTATEYRTLRMIVVGE
jgi:hypothetical protein